jgi:hypothetical protein
VAQGDETRERLGRCGGNGRAAFGVTQRDEIAIERVNDFDAGLATDEECACVVPHAVLVAVEITVEAALCDKTEVECCGTVRAKLPPSGLVWRWPGDADDRLFERAWFGTSNWFAVLPCTASADRRVLGVWLGELGNDGDARAVCVDATE